MNNLLEAALQYAAAGWHVFPLKPGDKTPITPHGCKDATTDAETIRAWWSKWPDANIGMACGASSGVYAVDVDVDDKVNGLETLTTLPPLPRTVSQDTPRGGLHAFYRADNPPANRNGFLPGIDIRGDGYYVVLAPSIHPNGGQYTWAPGCAPWEIGLAEYPDFLRPQQRPAPAAPIAAPAPLPKLAIDRDQREVAERYLAEIEPAVQGSNGHNKLLWAAGCMTHGCELSADQAYDILARNYNPRCDPPWDLADPKDERDFRRKIDQSIKNPPQKPRGWILHDPEYAQPVNTVSEDAIRGMLSRAAAKKQKLDEAEISVENRSEMDFLCHPTGLLGEICSWVNKTAHKPQPVLTLGCVLTFLGALYGRKIRDDYDSRTNLYCMGVAPTSAGKFHAMKKVRQLCTMADCDHLIGGFDFASDVSIEKRLSIQPTTLFLLDEIGHLISHIKTGSSPLHARIISLLMQLYSSASITFHGREYAESEKRTTIEQPCCCVYGASTPEKLTRGFSPDELADGWLSRCLLFLTFDDPRKLRGKHRGTKPPDHVIELISKWGNRVIKPEGDKVTVSQYVVGRPEDLKNATPEQILVPTTPEAEQRFIAFDDEAESQRRKSPEIGSLWAKGEENARRIALIVAASESYDNPTITLAVADYACRLIRWLIGMFTLHIAPNITANASQGEKVRVANVIRESGAAGIKKSLVTRKTQWLKDAPARDRILADLVDGGFIAFRNEVIHGQKVVVYYATGQGLGDA